MRKKAMVVLVGVLVVLAGFALILAVTGCNTLQQNATPPGGTPASQSVNDAGRKVGDEGAAVKTSSAKLRAEVPPITAALPASGAVVAGQADSLDAISARLMMLSGEVNTLAAQVATLEQANAVASKTIEDLKSSTAKTVADLNDQIKALKSDAASRRTTALIITMLAFIAAFSVCVAIAVWIPALRTTAIAVATGAVAGAAVCLVFTSKLFGFIAGGLVLAALAYVLYLAIKKFKATADSKTAQLGTVIGVIESDPALKAAAAPKIAKAALADKVSDALKASVDKVTG